MGDTFLKDAPLVAVPSRTDKMMVSQAAGTTAVSMTPAQVLSLMLTTDLPYHNHQAGVEKDEITNDYPLITEGIDNRGTGGTDDRGKLSVASGFVWAYTEPDFDTLDIIEIAALPFTAITNSDMTTYFCADTTTRQWVQLTDFDLIDYIRYVDYFIAYKRSTSTGLHHQPNLVEAHGELEAAHKRKSQVIGERYGMVSGFDDLAVDSITMAISTVKKQYVFAINIKLELPAITTATRQFKVGSNGTVTSNTNPIIIKDFSDEGAGLVALDPGRFVINWLFRGVEQQDHLYTMVSKAFDSLVEAQAYNIIGTPNQLIGSHAVIFAKVIACNTTPYDVDIETKNTVRW